MRPKGKPNAKQRGEIRKRRRKRAERREATKATREARNERMRSEGHLGWVAPPPRWTW
ncbi:hypothetical protein GII36_00765 [Candidatus Mycosynbacter amalyticus]|uniref:Uncharacterized protein n=1 Tax=Candidatus Mycosynbacter amalyticus TaxID=2665156 RepID=A0A857MMK1_9BACT|nr:hypothetical protein [Candidatus Mycosynbacter amalyticus]QHN42391.1 hypothetical protein GII36_00765 [Candidatus Mycosynbacter amalyticus]